MLLRFSILKKFLLVFLLVSVIPLCALGVSTLWNLRAIGRGAVDNTIQQMEKRAKESLELRAVELADRVTQLLHSCEGDLLTLAMLPREAEVYKRFSLQHRKTIWAREGTNEHPVEVHKEIPLYREIAFIGANGMETIRIVEDRVAEPAELRDVSKPENTTYKSEKYFQETIKLKTGDIYVSHVTGWFVSRDEQLQGARSVEEAVEGKKFEGVVRMATPCFTEAGQFEGMVIVSLDHRHLMELTLHILPTDERFVVFPSYASGNYAFMFDDDGWIIAHPKFYDIRGIYRDGSECDPEAPSYTRERLLAGEVPFNLDHVDFINPNYAFVAREVRAGRSGVISTRNVGGTPRVMAYAPIFYDRVPYNKHGIFGGMTIGVQTAKFAEPALLASAKIDDIVDQTKQNTLTILGITALAVIFLGTFLARKFTQPIMYLAGKARQIAEGHIPYYVAVQTGDELELLGRNFDDMATEIRRHRENLDKSFAALADSKKSVEGYSRQLEKQLKVLKNVHYLSQYLSTVYDRELVLQTVLKRCVEGLGYDRTVLYLYEQATRRLTCHQTFGFSPDHKARIMGTSYDIDSDDCIPTKAFRSGETIYVKDMRTDARATPTDLKIGEATETDCFVFTPIKSRDRVIGVLGADTNTTSREIRDVEIESLEIVANDAARAIERSDLYSKLVAERNFIKSIVTSMTSGIITLDENGYVTWFNPYSEAVFKIRPEDALGNHYRHVFRAFPDWIEVIDRYLNSPESVPSTLEKRSVFQDGKETVLEVHFSKINPQMPHQGTFLIFIRDVTQRKRMEEHIRRSDRLVSLGVLAAGIAHEMRNPLTGLSLLMDDVHDHLPEGSQARDLVRRSLQEIDRLENLINGLLDFAVPSRQVNLEVRPLGDVLHKTLFLLRKLCKNQKVTLTGHADESLPMLHLDADKLQQALLNLLLNAVQAMPEGGNLTVEVKEVPAPESLLSGPALRIVVSDTGIGIAPEDIPFIFDPFFTRTPSGCGLGLAIVHSIVQEHKGSVSVSSELSKGTTFWVDLPIVEEPAIEVEVNNNRAAEKTRAALP
ncbi:MAG: ATP-binding protein [Thermodesulfobacteriota bacterium]